MSREHHSHAEKVHRLQRSVVVDITKALYSHAVVVRDDRLGAPLWSGEFSDPCTKRELSELAYGCQQASFDPKLVLVPLGRLQKHPTRELPK